jgi:hypothetical protein
MHVLNQFFDKIYCINLDHRTDRWEECEKMFSHYNLSVERVSAIKPNENINNLGPGQVSLIKTTIQILEDAKRLNLKNFLLLEDDVEFCDYRSEYNGPSSEDRFRKYIEHLPEDWALFYLGSGIDTDMKYKIDGEIYKIGFAHTAHSLAFKNTFFDLCIEKLKMFSEPNDIIYARIMSEFPCYSFYPNLTSQRESFSDLENRFVNYNHLRNYHILIEKNESN